MVRSSFLWVLLVVLGLNSCNSDHDIPIVKNSQILGEFLKMKEPHLLNLLQNSAAGRPLYLCLTVQEGAEKLPLARKEIFVYQADVSGEYQSEIPGKENTAKIRGTGITDLDGRVLVRTLLPGDFGSIDLNRHIQVQIDGAYPKLHRIYFRQFANCEIQNQSRKETETHIVDLERDEASNLVAFLKLEVNLSTKPENNFSSTQ
ncbi:MAG: hypothetical protein R2879_22320 [Saprospiraceae bacterium]